MTKKKNIHKLDSNSMSTLKEMLLSKDETASNMGIVFLKNCDLKDQETINQLNILAQDNIMELGDLTPEVMKELLDVFCELEKNGLTTEQPKVILAKSKDNNDIVEHMNMVCASRIEMKFVERKKLAEEWLDEKCTDKRKEKIEEEIHKINKYVADMLGIEYNMNG
jgi:hypothetical protein